MGNIEQRLAQVHAVRTQLHNEGPTHLRPFAGDFERVALPREDCDILRDALIAEDAKVVIEVGLAYGSSALAIGEALLRGGAAGISHVVIDPYQGSSYANVGWEAICAAGLAASTMLITEPSSIALARLASEGFTADTAFVDGSHRFHEVFVDLYYMRKLVRPGGLIILDDAAWPSVAAALRYYDVNLGWRPEPIDGRLEARRLPVEPVEPPFTDFTPF
ncbi:MAG TPA: class I SAM-dependent methyltransferase [Longimicrobiales bacterium]